MYLLLICEQHWFIDILRNKVISPFQYIIVMFKCSLKKKLITIKNKLLIMHNIIYAITENFLIYQKSHKASWEHWAMIPINCKNLRLFFTTARLQNDTFWETPVVVYGTKYPALGWKGQRAILVLQNLLHSDASLTIVTRDVINIHM